MKINDITAFKVHSFDSASTEEELADYRRTYKEVPDEYPTLISSATEIELTHQCGAFLRIYGAAEAIEMDEGYSISENLHGAIPIGDDGNSRAVFYWHGDKGNGLYVCPYGSLFPEDTTFVASSLLSLVRDGVGVTALLVS